MKGKIEMKKLIMVCIGFGVLAWVGCGIFCGSSSPDQTAEKYVEKKFANIECDLSDLNYSTIDEKEEKATVKISGSIKYQEEIDLVKLDGKWMLADDAIALLKEKEAKAAKKAAPAKKVEKKVAKKVQPKAAHH